MRSCLPHQGVVAVQAVAVVASVAMIFFMIPPVLPLAVWNPLASAAGLRYRAMSP